jgi:hypothetical protein
MRLRWLGLVLAGVLLNGSALAFVCLVTELQLYRYNTEVVAMLHVPRPEFRHIPQCDKVLWLRIKDGC